jgi:surfeit locus 1 family protein
MINLFSRKWILATLLVVIGVGILTRLGIWQLDRLEARRAINAQVSAQVNQPALVLDAEALNGVDSSAALTKMEYRSVQVEGEYDFSQQVALRNQAWNNQPGVRLLTPLHIKGSDQVVLVDRGWIPGADYKEGRAGQYDEPGMVAVSGVIRRSDTHPELGRRTDPTPIPGGPRLTEYYLANIERIEAEMPYPLLPVFIQQSPDPAWQGLPYRQEVKLDLSEGPHLGYALQWFAFAAVLGLGYPFYVMREEKRANMVKHAAPIN